MIPVILIEQPNPARVVCFKLYLMKESQLLELAKSKGFEAVSDFVTGDFLVLCSIQKWLMDQHNIYIAVTPFRAGFSFIAAFRNKPIIAPNSFNIGGYTTWMAAYLQAIEESLNLLDTK